MPKANTTSVLLRDREQYTPAGLKSWSTDSLRNEYTRLRNIANNRLKHFEGSEWVNSEVYKQNFGKFKQLKGIKSNAELRKLTSEAAAFVTAKTSTVTGLKHQRAEAIRSLHYAGYGFVNKSNYNDFVNFMEDMRSRAKGRIFDSEQVAELYHQTVARLKMASNEVKKHFGDYMDMQDDIKKVPKRHNSKPINDKELRKMVEEVEQGRARKVK